MELSSVINATAHLLTPVLGPQEKRFVLTVTATDSGRRTDTAVLTVNVTDANNFAPSFENAPYAASVFEDAAVGTTVVVIEATDGDVGQNAHITYRYAALAFHGLGIGGQKSVFSQYLSVFTFDLFR